MLTLALGIGANASIFSVVRGVLLRPLVNRDEGRLIYIRQSAPGSNNENAAFSVPEILDLRGRMKTVSSIGDFSPIGFTMVGLGEPRQIRAGVVGGSYFEVMGLHPVLGRLINENDDGPNAAGVAVLTHRFWTTGLHSDPAVLGKNGPARHARQRRSIGVLEPSVPYPAETEIIANVVTSPHHLSATMVTGREHRMTELFARLAPGADVESARAELRAVHAGMLSEHPESYPPKSDFRIDAVRLRDQITSKASTVLLVLLAASALVFVIAVSNVANLILARSVRREGELAVRAALGASSATLRRTLLAESLVLCGTGAVLGVAIARPMVTILGRYAARFSVRALDSDARRQHAVGRRRPGDAGGGAAGLRAAAAQRRRLARLRAVERRPAHHRRDQPPAADVRGDADRRVVRADGRRRDAARDAAAAAGDQARIRNPRRARGQRAGDVVRQNAGGDSRLLSRDPATACRKCRASSKSPSAARCRGATPAVPAAASRFPSKD